MAALEGMLHLGRHSQAADLFLQRRSRAACWLGSYALARASEFPPCLRRVVDRASTPAVSLATAVVSRLRTEEILLGRIASHLGLQLCHSSCLDAWLFHLPLHCQRVPHAFVSALASAPPSVLSSTQVSNHRLIHINGRLWFLSFTAVPLMMHMRHV